MLGAITGDIVGSIYGIRSYGLRSRSMMWKLTVNLQQVGLVKKMPAWIIVVWLGVSGGIFYWFRTSSVEDYARDPEIHEDTRGFGSLIYHVGLSLVLGAVATALLLAFFSGQYVG